MGEPEQYMSGAAAELASISVRDRRLFSNDAGGTPSESNPRPFRTSSRREFPSSRDDWAPIRPDALRFLFLPDTSAICMKIALTPCLF